MITFETNFGDFTIEVDSERAPVTARNFIQYCKEGFYQGTIFHRVIPGFIIQGGGFSQGMKEKSTKSPIVNEANRGLKNTLGSIAMARTDAPHSATAEFFINLSDNPKLDFTATTNVGWGYAVFGQVTAGMDVIEKISKTATTSNHSHSDTPITNIIIQEVIISS